MAPVTPTVTQAPFLATGYVHITNSERSKHPERGGFSHMKDGRCLARRGSIGWEKATAMQAFSEKVSFIWSVANLLRGDYKPSEYGRVILPFLVLRRPPGLLDAVAHDERDDYRQL
jgi:hypothetical protein